VRNVNLALLACLVTTVCLGQSAKKTTTSSGHTAHTTSAACGVKCGQERWDIKTLTDPDATIFKNATATDATVAQLISQTPPAKLADTRDDSEKHLYHVHALLIGWKIEKGTSSGTTIPDLDFHMVIADPKNTKKQMIIEVPNPSCKGVCRSAFLNKFKVARTTVTSKLGNPTGDMVELPKPWVIDVTGPGFFDFSHRQDGLAPNCIEIHPVLEISFVQQKSNGPVHVNKASELPHHCATR